MAKNIEKRITSESLINADAIMERGVLLPLHHGMTNAMFERLHSVITEFLKNY